MNGGHLALPSQRIAALWFSETTDVEAVDVEEPCSTDMCSSLERRLERRLHRLLLLTSSRLLQFSEL